MSANPALALPVEPIPRLSLSRREAAPALGLSIRALDVLIAGRRGNKFPVAYVGSRPLIPVRELVQWLSDQADGGGG